MKQAFDLEWVPPCVGMFKVNFNRASFGNPEPAGYGFIVRDHHRNIGSAKGRPLETRDDIHAEILSLLESLRIIKSKNLINYIVEGDSKTVISWGRGEKCSSWRMRHFIYEIQVLIKELKVVIIMFHAIKMCWLSGVLGRLKDL